MNLLNFSSIKKMSIFKTYGAFKGQSHMQQTTFLNMFLLFRKISLTDDSHAILRFIFYTYNNINNNNNNKMSSAKILPNAL